MLILDGISVISNSRLHIPFYHRGHISLKSNTTVTLALIPPRASTESPKLTEMIVSPIKFDSWPSLWRLEATFNERPGVVNKLLTIIAEEGLNILNEESSSAENRDVHTVELIIDTSAAGAPRDYEQEMKALERRILALCIEEFKFEFGAPRLRLKRMKGLKNAWDKFQQSRKVTSGLRPVIDSSVISSGYIRFPSKLRKEIEKKQLVSTLLVSDTKERLLRVFFLSEHDGFTYVRIAHHDSPGALESITGELVKAFDIVNSFTRIQSQGAQNEFELLLHSSEFPSPKDEPKRRAIISNLLSHSDLSSLDLRVCYPQSVGSSKPQGIPPQPGKTIPFKQQERVARVDRNSLGLRTVEILKSRVREYERAIERKHSDDSQERLDQLRDLLTIEGEPPPQLKTFISYDTTRDDLRRIVSQKLKSRDCTVVTGDLADDLEGRFRDVIINRIRSCDGFLGIWTRRKNRRESPWFLWELAVAQAHKLPFRLLLQDGIDPEQLIKINPEQYHYSFTESDFSKKSTRAIQQLLDQIRENYRKKSDR